MVYLIKSGKYLKIGYTQNVETRMKVYNTYNPDFTLIDVIEGDEKLEKLLHKLFKDFKLDNRTEWFHADQFIINAWNSLKENNFIQLDLEQTISGKINIDYESKYIEIFKKYEYLKDSYKKGTSLRDQILNELKKTISELKRLYTLENNYNKLLQEFEHLKSQISKIHTEYTNLQE